jgi:hypothetical protein
VNNRLLFHAAKLIDSASASKFAFLQPSCESHLKRPA